MAVLLRHKSSLCKIQLNSLRDASFSDSAFKEGFMFKSFKRYLF